MTRIIIHPGFHKTGTTSLQNFLLSNRAALRPYFDFYGKPDFPAAGSHARLYAVKRFPWTLWRFRRAFRRFLAPLPKDRDLVISRETFSGGMPGHRNAFGKMFKSYRHAARPLAKVIVAEVKRKYGPQAEITFVYTTRDPEPWIASVHGHLLRSIRLTDDFATFRARFDTLLGPDVEAGAMRQSLHPVPVITAPLEVYGAKPHGAAEVILDLLDVPTEVRAKLKPVARSNVGQTADLRDRFLEMNRTSEDKQALRIEKKTMLRTGGRTP